ncbi:hypothetical protein TNCV_4324441 [Trichonephila clavipes]|nr:hypothetical protein TNCV_4324441 [Trichonephila clavipes]
MNLSNCKRDRYITGKYVNQITVDNKVRDHCNNPMQVKTNFKKRGTPNPVGFSTLTAEAKFVSGYRSGMCHRSSTAIENH